jgi:signal transduction histidine kinase
MGLAVVHGFVSEMGGYVSAGNVGGNGARFEVILPIRRDV